MSPKVAPTPAAFPPNITLEKKPLLEQHQMLSQELHSSEVLPTNILYYYLYIILVGLNKLETTSV